jgi:hypothetical protein
VLLIIKKGDSVGKSPLISKLVSMEEKKLVVLKLVSMYWKELRATKKGSPKAPQVVEIVRLFSSLE